jgi:hypothetical protein
MHLVSYNIAIELMDVCLGQCLSGKVSDPIVRGNHITADFSASKYQASLAYFHSLQSTLKHTVLCNRNSGLNVDFPHLLNHVLMIFNAASYDNFLTLIR